MRIQLNNDEVRQVQLTTLRRFDAFCDEIGVEYSLAYGTLLGAVRHKGYIPWDDDIDVMMLRPDYDKACRALADKRNDLGIGSPRTRAWPFGFSKVWDSRTTVIEDLDVSFECGVGVDIWPLDAVASRGIRRRLAFTASTILHACEVIHTVRPRDDHGWHKRILLRLLKPPVRVMVGSRLGQIRDRLASSRLGGNGDFGVLVGSYPWAVPRATLEARTRIPFENEGELPVPVGWREVLTTMYGDYMELPPVEKRVSHHAANAYWNSFPPRLT